MELIPEWAPNIHPMLVHFPIAVLLLAVVADLLSFFLPDRWWDPVKTTVLYTVGAVSGIITYYTGTLAAHSVFLPAGAQSVLTEHADWAWWTVWFFGLYALLRIGLHGYRRFDGKPVRIMLFLLALPGVFMLYETGDHGAKMVFGYGAGTGSLLEQETGREAATTDSLTIAGASTFTLSENGGWSWEIGPNGVSTLLNRFRWLQGGADDLRPAVVSNGDNHLLRLDPTSSPVFFVTRDSVQDVQVDYWLDFSGFDGQISLVTHVRDAGNYDFVTLDTDGTISQGRVSDGSREVLAEESYDASGMLFIRTVGNGTHFRGYIDREMVVHGHGDAPETGSVGMRLDGRGTVLLDRIIVTALDG
ncbi:MAG: DUF2231 domain-containing protein [Balneolaceae bacterium]|nr:DUF2231 domain-containing protein [Balneolaceae bacterium]